MSSSTKLVDFSRRRDEREELILITSLEKPGVALSIQDTSAFEVPAEYRECLERVFIPLYSISEIEGGGKISATDEEEIDITDGSFEELEIEMCVAGSERESIEMTSGSALLFCTGRLCLLSIATGGSFSLPAKDDSRLTHSTGDDAPPGMDIDDPTGLSMLALFRFAGVPGRGCV